MLFGGPGADSDLEADPEWEVNKANDIEKGSSWLSWELACERSALLKLLGKDPFPASVLAQWLGLISRVDSTALKLGGNGYGQVSVHCLSKSAISQQIKISRMDGSKGFVVRKVKGTKEYLVQALPAATTVPSIQR